MQTIKNSSARGAASRGGVHRGSPVALPNVSLPRNQSVAARRVARAVQANASQGEIILDIKGLKAKIVTTGQEILNGVNLTIREVCKRL